MKKRFTCILIAAACPAFLIAKSVSNNGHNLSGNGAFHFIENKGQVTNQYHQQRPDISFSLPSRGLSLFIGNGQLHYQFAKTNKTEIKSKDAFIKRYSTKEIASTETTMYRMDVTLVGANAHSIVTTDWQQPYTEHYYLPQTGKEGSIAHSYDKITYAEIYPHIDWVLYVKDDRVVYDFVVKPGGNVADIKIKYGGATSLTVDGQGKLRAITPMGSIEEQAPISYQGTATDEVNSEYVLKGDTLSFNVPQYDRKNTLTIDPTLVWQTTNYGGSDLYDEINSIATDASSNIYITGNTFNSVNIATTGAYQTVLSDSTNGGDAFLAQFNSAGVLQWGTYFGGTAADIGYGVACDGAGNVYITGSTKSSTGIATTGTHQTIPGDTTNGGDAFLAKFNTAGTLQWSTYYGGMNVDIGFAVACDGSGNVYITGGTNSKTGIATVGAYQQNIGDSISGNANYPVNIFVASFSSAGQLQWGTYYGSAKALDGPSWGRSIACDATGGIYVTGVTCSADGITTNGAYQSSLLYTDPNESDGVAFLSKFNNTGQLQWGTYYQGTAYYYDLPEDGYFATVDGAGEGVTCDAIGNVYICGEGYNNIGWATPGAYQTSNLTSNSPLVVNNWGSGTSYTNDNGFLAKFNAFGQRIWGTYYGGNAFTACNGIACDVSGNVYITANTCSDSGIVTPGSYDTIYTGNTFEPNVTLSKFDSLGNIQWGTYYGMIDYYPAGVVWNTSGLYIAGTAYHYDISDDSLFLAKFNDCSPSISQPGNISGPTNICPRGTYTYSIPAVTGATYYHWSLPPGWSSSDLNYGITNTNTITVTVDSTGAQGDTELIGVTANNICGSSVAQTLSVTINSNAVIHSSENGPICLGDTLKLFADTTSNNIYQWQLNNVNIAGATNASYTSLDSSGQYQYTLVVTNGGCVATSLPLSFTVNPVPIIAVTATLPNSFCQGDSTILIVYTDTAGGQVGITDDTYQWQFNGTNIPTTIIQDPNTGLLLVSDTAKIAGVYTIIATNTYNCPTKIADTIVVYALPTPTVNANGNTLATGSYSSYQWYNEGQAISGATNQTYTADDSGSYYVVVTNSNGCSGQSSVFSLTLPSGVSSINANQQSIQLYPDPNNGQFTLTGTLNNTTDIVNLEVIDVNGKVVMRDKIAVLNGVLNKQISMGNQIAAGMYTVKISTSDNSITIPFIKK